MRRQRYCLTLPAATAAAHRDYVRKARERTVREEERFQQYREKYKGFAPCLLQGLMFDIEAHFSAPRLMASWPAPWSVIAHECPRPRAGRHRKIMDSPVPLQ